MKKRRPIITSLLAALGLVFGSVFISSSAHADDGTEPVITNPMPSPGAVRVDPKPGSSLAACAVTSYTPRAERNETSVWFGGTRSGCSGDWRAELRWSKIGGTQVMATKSNPANGGWYGIGCNWPTPQNRNLYGRVVSGSVTDSSGNRTFTSATTNCLL